MPRLRDSSSDSGCAAVILHDIKGEEKKTKNIMETVTTRWKTVFAILCAFLVFLRELINFLFSVSPTHTKRLG